MRGDEEEEEEAGWLGAIRRTHKAGSGGGRAGGRGGVAKRG